MGRVLAVVPAQVCENCGEYYLSEDISAQVLKLADGDIAHDAEIEMSVSQLNLETLVMIVVTFATAWIEISHYQ